MNLPLDPTATPAPGEPVTLDNCEREPIHIPGSIQPHGALLGFDRLGRVTHLSANVAEMLGFSLTLGRPVRAADLGGCDVVHGLIQQAVADAAQEDLAPVSHEIHLAGHTFDLVIHSHGGVTVCEFERRSLSDDEVASFARKAYRSMDSLRRQRSIGKLLETAVGEVRAMTGFDRVMAYRFRHDDSGEVAAEARHDDLDPYLGRRYPASDIPAQARRLYILNTLRLIADVSYAPVPLLADPSHPQPLDLSQSVLRSVSPIHVEYLRNMGVSASMSVSIVIGGRLWGMIACHHHKPLQVPYSIRMAADVVAQLIASSIQSLTSQSREAEMARAALLRTEIAAQIAQGHDAVDVLDGEATALRDSLQGDAVVIGIDGKYRLHGVIDPAWAATLVDGLHERGQAFVHLDRADELPGGDPGPERYCGALGLCFDLPRKGWVVVLRREQELTIRWGGKPEKDLVPGPLGPRLTPRGSFDEWREIVRDTAEPWSHADVEIASLLADSVSRAHSSRVLELDRLRSQLWAVLGHDLRDPLQSLSMAAHALGRGGEPNRMTNVIRNSTNRMQRLLSDLQDITRVQNGLGLAINIGQIDLVSLTRSLLEDAQVAYPNDAVETDLPETLVVSADASRYLQVVSNLLSNARHHGTGSPRLALHVDDSGAAVLEVSNPSPPIPPEDVPGLFDPFKRTATPNPRNPGSMGLGLYIAHQVMHAHGGSLDYRHADGVVTFVAKLPVGLG